MTSPALAPAMTEVERIAAGLTEAQRACLLDDDPHHVSGSVATLLDVCLNGLADPMPDNSIRLTETGIAVRKHIGGGE